VAAGDLAWPAGRTGRDGRLNVAGDLSRPVKLQLFAADGRRQTVELQPPHKDDEGPARFVLTPPVRTAGRIIAAAGRRPLAAALIWPAHDPGTFVLTDSRGAYELMAPPDDRFSVHAQAAGFLPQAQGVRGGGSTERAPTLALTAAAAVTGQVVDRTGAPLPGVLLAATTLPPAQRPRSFHPDRADSRAASDARGGFTLGNLHPQAAHELTAAKAGFATATVTIDDFDRTASPERLRIVMEKARPAFGRVIDSAEQPVPGAEVRLRAAAPGSQDEPVTGLSDETGRFDLATVPGPRVDIEAQKKGFSPLTVRGVEVPAGKAPVDLGTLILGPGVMLRGLVVDTGDEPVAGAEVRVAEDDGRRASFVLRRLEGDQPRTATGPDGRFRIEDLEPGRKFHLLFRRAGYLPARVLGVEAPNSEPVVAVLEPASTLSGRVVDEDGAAIAGARVSVRGQDPPTGTVGVELRHRDVSRTVTTDQKGDFVIAELPPGKVEIEAAAAGFQPAPPQYVGIPAATSLDNLRFVLERGAVVEGRVSTAEGEPVAGARIRMAHARAASDADGIYRLEGIPLGKQFLTVGHLEFKRTARRLDVEPGVNLADVVLEGGWRVAGRVVDDDGTALEGARVELRLERMREMRQYEATSEADGQFSFPRVVDGSYDVAAEKSGYGGVELRRGLEVAGGSVEDLEVVLPSGASVVGRLLGLEFEELATAEVEAERDEQYGKPGRVDYDGGYEINDLGPGVWLVKARVRGGRRQTEARITIEPGGGQ
ncbi:MAG: carboxypeptidase regulatory-like domain-containing protein, partial [bacterium]|nr:carboxypeptidase regulatory-like domain-containing protein [bacterium]